MSADKAKELGVSPLGQIVGYGMVAGPDNSLLTQPSRAITKAARKAGVDLGAIDLFEINEAFAAVGLASVDDLGIDEDKVNVNGGAIALGHPVGMSGTRVALTALLELRRRGAVDGRRGAVRRRRPGRRRHPAQPRPDARFSRRAAPSARPAWLRRPSTSFHALGLERVDAERAGGEALAHRQRQSLLVARRQQPLREGCAVGLWPTTMAAATSSGSSCRNAITSSGSAP